MDKKLAVASYKKDLFAVAKTGIILIIAMTIALGELPHLAALAAGGGALVATLVAHNLASLAKKCATPLFHHARATYKGHRAGLRIAQTRHGIRAFRLFLPAARVMWRRKRMLAAA